MSNKAIHMAISNKSRSCLLNVDSKRGTESGLEKGHYLMVACPRLLIVVATSCEVGQLPHSMFNDDHLYNLAVVRQLETCFDDRCQPCGKSLISLSKIIGQFQPHLSVMFAGPSIPN